VIIKEMKKKKRKKKKRKNKNEKELRENREVFLKRIIFK
jgi:hypothetical protein